ncbi:MAG: AEC family transporter [Desulfovibrio sp.]|uniref:AEC family transporter n=1 Tax=Desulfovibrio sp. 7SRBS1 TaxID=3378064 RepID=UPI003B3C172F
MEQFIFISVFVVIGALFRRLSVFPKETAHVLNMFALYVALPAIILLKIPQVVFSSEMILPAIIPWVMLLLSASLVLWAGKFFNWSRQAIGVLLLVIPIGNTSFMGVPMVMAFFGEGGIPSLIIYDQVGTMLILAIYGSIILVLYGNDTKIRLSRVIGRAVLFPPTLALLAGLGLRSWSYPAPVLESLKMLAGMLTPLVMTAIGFQLRIRLSPMILKPLGIGLVVKLMVAPLVALLLCRLLGLHGMSSDIAIFEAGMPPMVTAGALAMAANLLPELAAATVSLGMVVAFATLPLLYCLI